LHSLPIQLLDVGISDDVAVVVEKDEGITVDDRVCGRGGGNQREHQYRFPQRRREKPLKPGAHVAVTHTGNHSSSQDESVPEPRLTRACRVWVVGQFEIAAVERARLQPCREERRMELPRLKPPSMARGSPD